MPMRSVRRSRRFERRSALVWLSWAATADCRRRRKPGEVRVEPALHRRVVERLEVERRIARAGPLGKAPPLAPPHNARGRLIPGIGGEVVEAGLILNAEDSIYFDATLPHGYRRHGSRACSAIVVTTGGS